MDIVGRSLTRRTRHMCRHLLRACPNRTSTSGTEVNIQKPQNDEMSTRAAERQVSQAVRLIRKTYQDLS